MNLLKLNATCPKGLGSLLVPELVGLGAENVRETPAGVAFEGTLATAYRACLWSRFANRILLNLSEFAANGADEIYEGVKRLPWHEHIAPGKTLAVDFSGRSESIRNTQFGAQRCKDGIVDSIRAQGEERPNVDVKAPDLRINVRIYRGKVTVAIDLAGTSLHRRGYRLDGGKAPLKENLAAAVLTRAGWPQHAQAGWSLIDPMCGSGTLLLEAAMMALNHAPGLERMHWGFDGWRQHDVAQWEAIVADARSKVLSEPPGGLEIRGYDGDIAAIRRAEENIYRLGLDRLVRVLPKSINQLTRPTHRDMTHGLLVCNPPWGERLSDSSAMRYLYRELGETMDREFRGWQAAVLTSNASLGRDIGLRSHRQYPLNNGALDVQILLFDLNEQNKLSPRSGGLQTAKPAQTRQERSGVTDAESAPQPWASANVESAEATESADKTQLVNPWSTAVPRLDNSTDLDLDSAQPPGSAASYLSPGAEMFANRVRKNVRKLRTWVRKQDISCYRLYDADMPEYAVAVDWYDGHIHVAEYAPPKDIDEASAIRRLDEVLTALPVALGLPTRTEIAVKRRRRQQGKSQYERMDQRGEKLEVHEGKARLLVNLHDYLDTGLFLDHRPLRLRIAAEAAGKHFLNLFCYTGVASLHAALGGAVTTTSVDLSNTYLNWFNENLALNGLSDRQHRAERADCMQWLDECHEKHQKTYDLILLDPPSFSNSKATEETFDVQRDHAALVERTMKVLSPQGVLYFSNNRKKFRIAEDLKERFEIADISAATIPEDFERRRDIHQCWQIRHRP